MKKKTKMSEIEKAFRFPRYGNNGVSIEFRSLINGQIISESHKILQRKSVETKTP